jgi:hypothetical protein
VLAELGLSLVEDDARRKASGGERGNLVATLAGSRPGVPPMLFCAHMATFLATTTVVPVVEAGRMRSAAGT